MPYCSEGAEKIERLMYWHMKLSAILSRLKRDICRPCRVLIVLLAYAVTAQSIFHPLCSFAILTGFPRPGCGLIAGIPISVPCEGLLRFVL